MIRSLDAACIECPQCLGDGLADLETGRVCPICQATFGRGWGAWTEERGYLDLPLTPEIADRIYARGNAACMELVNEAAAPAAEPVHLFVCATPGQVRAACGLVNDHLSASHFAEWVTCPACYVVVGVDHALVAFGGDR